ncbi:hypothetical protein KR093_005162, partial [Drosophila rubida]
MREWQLRWDNDADHGRVTLRFFPDAGFVFSRPDFGFSLRAGFLLTGHGSLNGFLHQRALSSTPACSCGAPLESWLHMLCECPLYADIRRLDDMGILLEHGVWCVHGVTTS